MSDYGSHYAPHPAVGFMGGFMGEIERGRGQEQELQTARTDLERRVYETLIQSSDPELQARAMSGLLEQAGKAGKGKKNFFGRFVEESPSDINMKLSELLNQAAQRGQEFKVPQQTREQGIMAMGEPGAGGGGRPPPQQPSAAMPGTSMVTGGPPSPYLFPPAGMGRGSTARPPRTPDEEYALAAARERAQRDFAVPPKPATSPDDIYAQETARQRARSAFGPPRRDIAGEISGRMDKADRLAQEREARTAATSLYNAALSQKNQAMRALDQAKNARFAMMRPEVYQAQKDSIDAAFQEEIGSIDPAYMPKSISMKKLVPPAGGELHNQPTDGLAASGELQDIIVKLRETPIGPARDTLVKRGQAIRKRYPNL